jgi:hypothetical protein
LAYLFEHGITIISSYVCGTETEINQNIKFFRLEKKL